MTERVSAVLRNEGGEAFYRRLVEVSALSGVQVSGALADLKQKGLVMNETPSWQEKRQGMTIYRLTEAGKAAAL